MGDLGHELYEEIRRQVECGKRHIYLTKPHFLYVTDEQSRLFEEATKNNPCYRDSLDEPIRSLLRENSPLLFKDITQAAHFIDLGPGYPSKSMALIDYFISKGTRVTYYAVDISRFFLERAVAAAHARGISSYPLNRRFEELGPILDRNLAPTTPRVIFIGLTFCNFDINTITQIIQKILRHGDLCIICAQLLSENATSTEDLIAPYRGDAVVDFAFCPLERIGISRDDVQYSPGFYDMAVHADFLVRRDIDVNGIAVVRGTKITMAKSYRYNIHSLISHLDGVFYVRHQFLDQIRQLVVLGVEGK